MEICINSFIKNELKVGLIITLIMILADYSDNAFVWDLPDKCLRDFGMCHQSVHNFFCLVVLQNILIEKLNHDDEVFTNRREYLKIIF